MPIIDRIFPFYLSIRERIRQSWPRPLLVLPFYGTLLLGKMWILQDERAVEYPWILKELKRLHKNARVLDVGCGDSLFSHALVAQGFETWGIDVRPYDVAHPRLRFVQRDIVNSGLPDSFFDALVANSVLEHIGLDSPDYDDPIHQEGDFLAVREIRRVLKAKGLLILTLPLGLTYRNVVHRGVKLRIYTQERLERLTDGFRTLRADVYWRHGARWRRTNHLPTYPTNAQRTDLIVCMTLEANS
jgi:SAM-dependent methyltransferase